MKDHEKEKTCLQNPVFDPQVLLHQIHIWRVDLDDLKPSLSIFWTMLSQDEKGRANGYISPCDQTMYILRRGFLRDLLAHYLDQTAEKIRFRYSINGKPALVFPGAPSIDFNLSHSSGTALYAFTQNRQVGIDLERRREDIDLLEMSDRYFSPNERKRIRSLSEEHRTKEFFRIWTRKEAFVKAHGEGLSLPLDQFDVGLAAGRQVQWLADPGNHEPVGGWDLVDIQTKPDFEAALAVSSPIPEIQFFDEAALDGFK